MSKGRKIFLGVVMAGVILFAALLALAHLLITPERVRQAILPLAEEALERRVELGMVDVSLFSGISLTKLTVRNRADSADFVAADRVVLRYSLFALLTAQVKVDEITLVNPRIEIIRKRDGSFNFSDLTGDDAGPEATPGVDTVETGSAINLNISRISIQGGELLFIDNLEEGEALRHQISNFQLKASDISTRHGFPLELSAEWNKTSLALDGVVNLADASVDLNLQFSKIRAQVTGGIEKEKLKGTLKLPKTSFTDLLSSIPTEYAPGLEGLDLTGSLIANVAIDDDAIRTSELVLEINEQVVNFDLQADNLYSQPIRINFGASSDQLDIDKMMPVGTAEADAPSTGTTRKAAEEIGPFDLPLNLSGNVQVGKVLYQGVPLTDLALQVSLKKNVFKLESLRAKIAGGEISKRGVIDLGVKGLKYSGEFNLQGVRGEQAVALASPELAGSVQGLVGGDIKLAGAGTLPEPLKKNLTGAGAFRLRAGKLQDIPALNSVAALLDINQLNEIILDDGTINFKVNNGQVQIDSKINGPTTRLTTGGQVDLNGGLNLRSQLALSPELGGRLHKRGKLTRYLGDDAGWTTVPLLIKGSYDSPDVGLDSKALKKQAEKKVKEQMQEKIEEKIKDKLRGLLGN